ncbi:MAG: hypothetical protein A2381_09930 [Bdellovibrionales bacterium RIFOXYB1_FULL_37_110]|nr:MAG: hypothetical protein A2181_03010 [Bdellovibrionales bacterium RIFOXYA1_FULL_38_20]OFZ48911.1 MAG: hypothetical protein A2417_08390 [Bdellovibrionales bacterium RIFOXYC1_FULL_37_79]OFZ59588.1 MAG: hypothetical protein A2381_09930 [Bdellovibrionales bacterium RIFOXYB1_FULL_37_110]OFZ62433.1 MAG: hypothetical protein A2577_03325 [Bdellovibrionales bacterium RIFOXYD1_FULL_36_51]
MIKCCLFIILLGFHLKLWAEALEKQYSFVPRTFSSKVEQVTLSALSGKEKKTYGTMDYMYPGKFRYEQEKPENSKIIFVSNQSQSWFYTAPFLEGEPGDLIINPMKDKFSLSELFDLLQNGLSSNKMYKVQKQAEAEHLTFSKKVAKNLGINKAILTFNKSNLSGFDNIKSVKIIKDDGSAVLFNLLEIKPNLQFGKDHFLFTPPPNTKINKH